MTQEVTISSPPDSRSEPPQSEAKPRGIVQRLFGSLALKVGAAVIVTEILVLAAIGIPLSARHGADLDRAAVDRILLPGTLLQERVLSYASIADRRIMTELLGEELIGGMVVGGNGNVFYSLDSRNLGRDIGALPGVDPAWFHPSNTERQLIESQGDGETFLISITPLFTLGSKVPSLFAFIKTNTTMLTENKAAWHRLIFLGALAVVLTTSFIIFISFQMLIFRRIVRSADFVQRVREGDLDIRVATPGSDEFGTLERGMIEMVVNIKHRQEQQTKSEEALRGSEQLFRSTFEQAAVGIAHVAIDGAWLRVNQRLCAILGYDEKELLALRFQDITAPDSVEDNVDHLGRLLRGDEKTYTTEKRYVCKDGSLVWVNLTTSLVRGADDEPSYFVSVIEDISERKQAQEELQTTKTLLELTFASLSEALFVIDPMTREIISCNPASEKIFGYSEEEILGRNTEFLHRDKAAYTEFGQLLFPALGKDGEFHTEYSMRRKDGTIFDTDNAITEIRDESGKRIGVISIVRDITDRKRLEEQYIQAQKMEAVGQLTAGVAHDFNNMLAVIWGNAELLEGEFGKDNPQLTTVFRAAERGADLTQRLLAFSRTQVLNPEIVDANNLIVDTTGLLRRILEEHIDIETITGAGLWNCEVDSGQLENALVNLAINARDAMPNGGKLTIETANSRLDDDYAAAQAEVRPGQYVMLAVTDTGSGMSAEVQEHVFEPFYTTKAVGAGSGLGLSMVYGFVKQSGGHVTIYSEEGEGTTIKLYLPRSTKTEAVERKPVTDEVPVARGETVLVVEDDPDLRTLAVALLGNLGYQVMEAAAGPAALEQLGSTTGVDLLLTDVVLPGGMNGRELAVEVERRAPGIQVLYMSGYTADAIMHNGRLDADAELLKKPFRRTDLARAVRRALDGPLA